MFTVTKGTIFSNAKNLIEAVCLSTDSKPTDGIANGSMCLEMDTGKIYIFDEEGTQWLELSGGSSGEGGLVPVDDDEPLI